MKQRLQQLREETGAMLIFALLIITTVAVVTGALLTHSGTNLVATTSLRGVAGTAYAADAAAKVAINDLRLGSNAPDWTTPGFNGMWNSPTGWVFTNNSDGAGCFGATGMAQRNTLELTNLAPKAGTQTADTSARVECEPVDGTGILGSGGGVVISDPDATDPYARALTTVGTSADPHDGAYFNVLGSGNEASAPIGGGVGSMTTVTADHGDVTTDGYVWANGSCTGGTGRVVSSDTQCPKAGGLSTPDVPDSPLAVVPPFQNPAAVTDCHFQPGYYNNGSALSAAVNGCSIAYFVPGQYYFDFRDGNPWDIDTKVIGGVPTATTAMPGSCKSPIYYDPVAGVQFVFGGSSTIFVENNAQVELCGPSNSGDAPLVIYQQQTGTSPTMSPIPAQSGGAVATAPTSTPSKTDAFVVSPDQPAGPAAKSLKDAVQLAGDGLGAKWTSTKKDNTGELDISAFAGLAAIPANAAINSAIVHVTYSTPPPAGTVPTAGVSGVSGASAVNPTGDADVTTFMQASLAAAGFNSTNKPTIQLKIPASPKDTTLTIDRVTLAVTWSTATLEPTTNTTFIGTKNNSPAKFVVQGATYAPDGFLTMYPGNDAGAVVAFRWGLVAQGVRFNAQPQQLFGYPLVSIPVAGHGLGTRLTAVDLTIYVCVSSATCGTGGTHALTVRAMVTDPPYDNSGTWKNAPQPGRRQIKILSWAEQR